MMIDQKSRRRKKKPLYETVLMAFFTPYIMAWRINPPFKNRFLFGITKIIADLLLGTLAWVVIGFMVYVFILGLISLMK